MEKIKRKNIKIRKRNNLIFILLLFLTGVTILLFPKITNNMYNKKVKKLEDNFEKIVYEQDSKTFDALYDLLNKENIDLFNSRQKEFLHQEIKSDESLIDLNKYGLDDGIIGFINIPSIDVNLPIYLGASEENMKKGAVHLTGTSYPIGGINTNSVIAAHRGYYKSLMFRHINKIKIGDILYIKNFNGILKYTATKIDVIDPGELDKVAIQEGKDMVTIMSCHPFLLDYQRYVVYFERA